MREAPAFLMAAGFHRIWAKGVGKIKEGNSGQQGYGLGIHSEAEPKQSQG